MPMSVPVLALAIETEVDLQLVALIGADYVAKQPFLKPRLIKAFATGTAIAVVAHIAAFAQVDGIVVASVTAVTPGVGVSGPGTATAAPGSIT